VDDLEEEKHREKTLKHPAGFEGDTLPFDGALLDWDTDVGEESGFSSDLSHRLI